MQPCFRQCHSLGCCFPACIVWNFMFTSHCLAERMICTFSEALSINDQNSRPQLFKGNNRVYLAVPLKRSKSCVRSCRAAPRNNFLSRKWRAWQWNVECVHLGSAFLAPENGWQVEPVPQLVSNTFLHGDLIIRRNQPLLGFSGLLQLCFSAHFSFVASTDRV